MNFSDTFCVFVLRVLKLYSFFAVIFYIFNFLLVVIPIVAVHPRPATHAQKPQKVRESASRRRGCEKQLLVLFLFKYFFICFLCLLCL